MWGEEEEEELVEVVEGRRWWRTGVRANAHHKLEGESAQR